MSGQYAGRQIVGMDLVRMTETGETLETVRISNDLEYLRQVMERAGEHPEVVLEATYGWYWAADTLAELGAHMHLAHPLALVALRVSTGARAAELLGATVGDVDPGQQLITVIRKGTQVLQPLPASPDAFVWLRLYQPQLDGLVPAGRDEPLWWTLRRPFRALGYDGARAMFTRANAALGANWSLHDLRHTAAYRMARDPQMPLTDVQWVLGHAHLSTTQRYLNPVTEDVIAGVLAFHARQRDHDPAAPPAAGYRAESLRILFGEGDES